MSNFLSRLALVKEVKSNEIPDENKTSVFQEGFFF